MSEGASMLQQGIGRIGYIVASVLIGILIMLSLMVGYGLGSDFIYYGGLLLSFACVVISVSLRIQNIGYSRWFSLLLFVPVVNFFLTIVCMSFPSEFSLTKKLDHPAYIIIAVLVVIYASSYFFQSGF